MLIFWSTFNSGGRIVVCYVSYTLPELLIDIHAKNGYLPLDIRDKVFNATCCARLAKFCEQEFLLLRNFSLVIDSSSFLNTI